MKKPKSVSVSDLSLEDLLKSVEGYSVNTTDIDQDPSDIKFNNSPVLSFIQAFGIGTGKHKVSIAVLYKLFLLWDKSGKYRQAQYFSYELSKFVMPCSKYRNQTYFRTTKHVFEIGLRLETLRKQRAESKQSSRFLYTQFKKFLEDHKITEGNFYVEIETLRFIYIKWLRRTRKKRNLGPQTFKDICLLFFKEKQTDGDHDRVVHWVGVNPEVKDLLTEEELRIWKSSNYEKKQTNKKKKTKT